MEFGLWDAATSGSLLRTDAKGKAPVTNGLFTVELDFGAGVFTGDARWLEIAVSNIDADPPEAPVTLTPYAILSGGVVGGGITVAMLVSNSITGDKIAAGAIGSSQLATGAVGTAQLAANSVTADKLAVGVGGLPATAVVLSEYEVNPNLLNAGFVPTGVFSTNVGWISLSNAVARVQTDILLPGVDSDGDGIPDAWEMKYFGNLTTATASSDRDGDGVSDLAEYLADTDPTDSASRLRIKSIETGTDGSPVALTWPSRSSRCYYIQKAGDLNTPINWLDSGLGLILPDAGDETSRKLLDPAAPMRFFRIEAVKPLTP